MKFTTSVSFVIFGRIYLSTKIPKKLLNFSESKNVKVAVCHLFSVSIKTPLVYII